MRGYRTILAISLGLCVLFAPGAAHAMSGLPERLSLNGYFDATAGYNRYGSGTSALDAYHWVTLFNWQVTPRVRVFGDITFEHGTLHTESSTDGDLKTRSFVQLRPGRWLKVNVGRFLTPFGHFNLVHDATPTYLSVTSPRSLYWKRQLGEDALAAKVSGRLFAKESAGIWLAGSRRVGTVRGGWDLYVTNGRARSGSNEFKVDDNRNKAVGGRLRVDVPGGVHLGGSLYAERHGALGTTATTGEGARLNARAAELEWRAGRFTVRGEHMLGTIRAHGALPESRPLGQYLQGSARFGRVTPYYRHDRYRNRALGESEEIATIGVNVAVDPRVYFKVEHGFYAGADDVFQMQLAVAY